MFTNIESDENGRYIVINGQRYYRFTSNFKVSEMFVTSTSKELQKRNYENVPAYVIVNLFRLCNVLELIRHFLGDTALVVNSGYRCEVLNMKVGGVPTSHHRLGRAADIAVEPTEKLLDYLNKLRDVGLIQQVVLYPNFIHIAVPDYSVPYYFQSIVINSRKSSKHVKK